MVLYATLALTVYFAYAVGIPSLFRRWICVIGFVSIIATMDEALQHFNSDRSGRIDDVFLDIVGSIIGILLAESIVKMKNIINNHR